MARSLRQPRPMLCTLVPEPAARCAWTFELGAVFEWVELWVEYVARRWRFDMMPRRECQRRAWAIRWSAHRLLCTGRRRQVTSSDVAGEAVWPLGGVVVFRAHAVLGGHRLQVPCVRVAATLLARYANRGTLRWPGGRSVLVYLLLLFSLVGCGSGDIPEPMGFVDTELFSANAFTSRDWPGTGGGRFEVWERLSTGMRGDVDLCRDAVVDDSGDWRCTLGARSGLFEIVDVRLASVPGLASIHAFVNVTALGGRTEAYVSPVTHLVAALTLYLHESRAQAFSDAFEDASDRVRPLVFDANELSGFADVRHGPSPNGYGATCAGPRVRDATRGSPICGAAFLS